MLPERARLEAGCSIDGCGGWGEPQAGSVQPYLLGKAVSQGSKDVLIIQANFADDQAEPRAYLNWKVR